MSWSNEDYSLDLNWRSRKNTANKKNPFEEIVKII